jgi:hypothetical protein
MSSSGSSSGNNHGSNSLRMPAATVNNLGAEGPLWFPNACN